MVRAYVWMKYYSTPPPSTLSSQIETGAGGVQTQITEKNSDKGVYCWFFCNYIIFFTVQKGRNIYRWGEGATFYYFFFGGGGVGGVGGVTNPYFYRNLYNLWFFGGGGVRTTYPSLDSRMGKK